MSAAAAAATGDDAASPPNNDKMPLERMAEETVPIPFGTFSVERTARHIVDGIPFERRIVLLGESTHGTEEYYQTRAEITKRLIDERGFSCVVFEADWPFMHKVNDYVHHRRQTPWADASVRRQFPSWMWQNECMQQFYDWCKRRSASAGELNLFGMDCYSLFESKKAVISFLEEYDKEFAEEVKSRLHYIDKFDSPHQYADAVINGSLKLIAQHIQDCLTKIQSRLQWGSDKYKCTPLERFSAEQNCEVLIAADEYYRKCISEPAGSQASWNARDQHMTTTLLRMDAHLKNPKIVVWAHNSHIGDSTATKRGGTDFERNETWNLGQMTRATFGIDRTWVVGQYTYSGTVVAANHWGGDHANRNLRNAVPESYEAEMHTNVQTHVDKFCSSSSSSSSPSSSETCFFFATAPFADPTGKCLLLGSAAGSFEASVAVVQKALQANDPVAKALVQMLKGGTSKLQRWVGVSYKPDTERQSHYGEMELARCYDQIVYVDETHGLLPIQPKPAAAAAAESSASSKVVTAATTRRLLKEYNRLLASPPPGIEAHPLESDILEWHFLIKLDQGPYAGGQYHGVLTFTPDYPNAPGKFVMLTPSGRYAPGESLCLSMTQYHKESWSPSWTIETMLVGLQSFMYEESNAIGSIRASDAERKRLAAASEAFNRKNPVYMELFGPVAQAQRAGKPIPKQEETQESTCRFCLESGGKLIAPCMCKGSNEWVHLECLRAWQKRVLLDQPTHPKYQTSIDRICNICLEEFTGEGIPPARHEQILNYAGRDLAALVKAGNLLVSSREKSREYLELMQSHPEIKKNLSPWTKAVFLIILASKERMIAVSMSVPIEAPVAEAGITARAAWALKASRASSKGFKIRHFDGGPMHREEPQAVVHLANAEQIAKQQPKNSRVVFVPPHWLFSFGFDEMEEVVTKEVAARRAAQQKDDASAVPLITINVVWGCGGWGGEQVIAEIARGGWGIATIDSYMSIRPDPNLEIDWTLDLEWSRIVPMAKVAPPSEYSKAGL